MDAKTNDWFIAEVPVSEKYIQRECEFDLDSRAKKWRQKQLIIQVYVYSKNQKFEFINMPDPLNQLGSNYSYVYNPSVWFGNSKTIFIQADVEIGGQI